VDGLGADHILIVAGGTSNGPVEAAARLARDRATVVDIGKTRLDLPWNAYYDKELDVRFLEVLRSRAATTTATSSRASTIPPVTCAGPSVRNLACFVDLLARGQLDVESLVSGTFAVERAVGGLRPAELGRPSRRRASCSSTPPSAADEQHEDTRRQTTSCGNETAGR
jgi:threonine dehydrogenase-like Zn-dependent dehydrogenase